MFTYLFLSILFCFCCLHVPLIAVHAHINKWTCLSCIFYYIPAGGGGIGNTLIVALSERMLVSLDVTMTHLTLVPSSDRVTGMTVTSGMLPENVVRSLLSLAGTVIPLSSSWTAVTLPWEGTAHKTLT